MRKRTILFVLAITLGLYFAFREDQSAPEVIEDDGIEEVTVRKRPDTKPKIVNNTTTQTEKLSPKAQSNQFEQEKILNDKVTQLNQEIQKCQQKIAAIFPQFDHQVDTMSMPFEEIKIKVEQFYGQVNNKILASKNLMEHIESLSDTDIDPKVLFQQLSNVEDCGDFEEDTLLDIVITSSQSDSWSKEQKKEILQTFIGHFKRQLSLPLGFHQVLAKVEALQVLTEEGFVGQKHKIEMVALERVLEDAQFDYQRSFPTTMVEEKKITPSALAELKQRERDEVGRLKTQVIDYIRQVEDDL
jgi:hypothetical protein